MVIFLANGCNYFKTARELGMPYGTLRLWVAKSKLVSVIVSEHRERFEKTSWSVLNDAMMQLRKRVNSSKTKTAELLQVINVLFEKGQLLQHQPTSISAHHEHSTGNDDKSTKESISTKKLFRDQGKVIDGDEPKATIPIMGDE